MKRLILFCLLAVGMAAQSLPYQWQIAANTAGIAVSGNQPTTNTNGPYLFVWDTTSGTANYINYPAPTTPPETTGALSGVESIVGRFYPSTADITITANPNDSNNLWLHVPNVGNFPSVSWFWNGVTSVWGSALGKGWTQFDFMYEGTYATNRLLFQRNSKAPAVPSFDDNVGVSLRTKTIGGLLAPGVGTASGDVANVQFVTAAAGTKYTLHYRWNNMTANPSGVRSRVLYVLENGGTVRSSNHATTTIAPRTANVHQLQYGNDTNLGLEYWLGGPGLVYLGETWQYDLPVNLWQDFEGFAGTSISQAELEASDHNPSTTWALAGTTSRFTVESSAGIFSNAPCTIQLWNDTGTHCLRNDLSSTAAGSFGFTFTASTTVKSVAFDFYSANLASGTTSQVLMATDGSNTICAVRQRNTAGQQELVIANHAGTTSTAINISANTQYHLAFNPVRNSTTTLTVYDASGALVGSTTVTASNNSISAIRFGSLTATTAQAAGVYWYARNLVWDNNSTPFYPLKYTE